LVQAFSTLAATAHSKLFGSLHSTATFFCMHFSVASVAELLFATVCGARSVAVAGGGCQPNNL